MDYSVEQLKLVRIDDGSERIIETELYLCEGVGSWGLGGFFWSPSSRYFYYTHSREGMGEIDWVWYRGISQLDTVSGIGTYLGAGPLSPDKIKFAFWQWPQKEFVVWGLDEGEILRLPGLIADTGDGPIAWSPDSQALVYIQGSLFEGHYYAVHVSLAEAKQKLLVELINSNDMWVDWSEQNVIDLHDSYNHHWRYNLLTGELVQYP
jgi:hypothetical protein